MYLIDAPRPCQRTQKPEVRCIAVFAPVRVLSEGWGSVNEVQEDLGCGWEVLPSQMTSVERTHLKNGATDQIPGYPDGG